MEKAGTHYWDGVRNYQVARGVECWYLNNAGTTRLVRARASFFPLFFQARNNMRAMKRGDLVLYYHSSCKQPGVCFLLLRLRASRPLTSAPFELPLPLCLYLCWSFVIVGVVGIVEVTREGYPDSSSWDPKSPFFDPKCSPDDPVRCLAHSHCHAHPPPCFP
jgi:predicted RNA-binding protein with PUA-like domain